jgi:hypothetical protein
MKNGSANGDSTDPHACLPEISDRRPAARPPDKRHQACQIGENPYNSTALVEKPGIVLLVTQ